MKRQSLYIGGALLATTALSTSAYAGSVITKIANGNAVTPGTTIATLSLAAQVFPATNANVTSVGPAGFTVNFSNSFTTSFDLEVESTNSNFTSLGSANIFGNGTGSTVSLLTVGSDYSGCTVQVLTERILVEDCLQSAGGGSIDAVSFSAVGWNTANGLATAGQSIAISGIVRGSASNSTFELVSSGTLITSSNAASATVTANASPANINNSATPPFSGIGTGTTAATTFTLGTVRTTQFVTLSNNLTSTLDSGSAISAGMEITVTHGVLTDAATDTIDLGLTAASDTNNSVRASNFTGNVASFNVSQDGILGSYDLEVNFDGTTAISAWAAGTADVVFTTGVLTNTAIPSATGALAALNRGGFSTQINTAQSSAGNGSTLFQSLVRVTNNGSVDGVVSIAVRDDSDGSLYGTYTTETIEANSSIQVSMPTIESALGITAAGQYQLGISGSIDGYAQHVMFNSVDNLFVDLSGFRNANP